MSKPVKISTVLTRAAKYLESAGWAKGAFFKWGNGRSAYPKDGEEWPEFVARAKDANCKACALGAIYVGAGGDEALTEGARKYLERQINQLFVPSWNDQSDRTKDEVVQGLKDAAKAARKDGK